MDITKIQSLQQQLAPYHGAVLLSNIAELEQQDLLAVLGSSYEHLTVSKARQTLLDNLSAESVVLQMKKFQEALKNETITRGAGRLEGNKRKELFKDYKLYELLQIAFSPAIHYFQINPKAFKKGDTTYNNELFKQAIDAMVIDPALVSESSLDALGIKQLDPDCQNLKEVFKKMLSLKYVNGEKTVYTPTINTYGGKFITFSSQSVIFPVEGTPTQAEKNKEDIRTQMAVYPNLFSMLRREGHILDVVEEKKDQYKDIIKELISMINEIDWNQKCYGVSVRNQVKDIIKEIDAATSAKIVAQKINYLYKVHGHNSVTDKKLLEAAITRFTKRIGGLIGISAHVQLHALVLEDRLDKQQNHLNLSHSSILAGLKQSSSRVLFALENYLRYRDPKLSEPFLSFDRQITDINLDRITPLQLDIFIHLQRCFLEAYTWEHAYKQGELSLEDLQNNLLDSPSFDFPSGIFAEFFEDIYSKRSEIGLALMNGKHDVSFAELTNMHYLTHKIQKLLSAT